MVAFGKTAPPRAATARAPETIRRGARLRILVRSGALLIETAGRLMQDASVGELAALRVDATRATVTGKIIDTKSAEVLL